MEININRADPNKDNNDSDKTLFFSAPKETNGGLGWWFRS